jgi:glycosyltransferase involved in cell wall biosynthesis
MPPAKVLIAQLGARKHYQEPILFHESGMLHRLYTDFYSGDSRLVQLLRHDKIYHRLPSLLKKGLDRYDPALKNARIIHFPRFGYQYAQALRKTSRQEASLVCLWAGKEFCKRIIQKGLGEANVVYGFNGASLELFEYAKAQGVRCILDQSSAERSLAHQLLLEEEQSWPEWSLRPFTVKDADRELAQREQREQYLADHIICGSNFVKDSLIATGVSANKISVVALGRAKDAQLIQTKLDRKTPQERGDGLRILFAGAVSLHKGIPYLLEALRYLKGKIPFTCKVVGSVEIQPERVAEYNDVCNFMGRVPRSQMADFYAWADVFVFPAICEGSAMVTYEALSWGLPVITTHNAGSIVRNTVDGWLVPLRDSEAIAKKLLIIFDKTTQFVAKPNNLEKHLEEVYNQFFQIFIAPEI